MFRKKQDGNFHVAGFRCVRKMTLGISPAVSSCTDPLAIAICWFLALKSRRKAPAHCI
jgi:hypothetical protein